MMPEMNTERFLPMFIEYMKTPTSRSDDTKMYVKKEEQITCQVISMAKMVVLSDGFHKVRCQFDRDAIINFKYHYPVLNIKALDKCFIILMSYAPHTITRENDGVEPIIHVYRFVLHEGHTMKRENIHKKLTELADAESIKENAYLENIKHIKRIFSRTKVFVNDVPPLEEIVDGTKPTPNIQKLVFPLNWNLLKNFDELGKNLVRHKDIDTYEKQAIEEAAKLLADQKKSWKKYKETGKAWAERMKKRPRSLSKEMNIFWRQIREKNHNATKLNETMKDDVAAFIEKNNNPAARSPTRNASTHRINRSIRKTETKFAKASEFKVTNKHFSSFLNWKARMGNVDRVATNVTDELKIVKPHIKLDLTAPVKLQKKAFSGWSKAETPGKKRFSTEGVSSVRKSTKKGNYGPV